ncbi:MAG: RidA family protein [Chloroflexi bacterium]|nr:RidA family protein [Chloroflexota bacterium]
MAIADRLRQLGYALPERRQPLGTYVPAVRLGNVVYTSGQISGTAEREIKGKLGESLSVDEGQEAARLALLNCLAAIAAETGSLDAIRRVVRVAGYVNSAPGFTRQPEVINGASDLLGQLFGEAGRHVRASLGVNELPANYAVELELWVEVS